MSKTFNEAWEEWEAAKRNFASAIKSTPAVKTVTRFCYWLLDRMVIWIDRLAKKQA